MGPRSSTVSVVYLLDSAGPREALINSVNPVPGGAET